MTYVMSDLHGRFDKYNKMLEQIQFDDKDTLYILGDICDRGPQSAQIYLDIMKRNNVLCIMGNHEKMLLEALPNSFAFLLNKHGYYGSLGIDAWNSCGGGTTCASFIEVGIDKVIDIYKYIISLPLYTSITVDEKNFLLVHAGLHNYDQSRPIGDYQPDELVWYEPEYDSTYYPMEYDKIIVGHTPTFLLNQIKPASIYHGKGNIINIDCGAVYETKNCGRLGCLCLETMAEYYV